MAECSVISWLFLGAGRRRVQGSMVIRQHTPRDALRQFSEDSDARMSLTCQLHVPFSGAQAEYYPSP